ncbi:MAG: metallophosphoesterase [Oscillospiraceae bacterium]
MALYAIGDLHLSFTTNKPMNIFGTAWENHEEKLKSAFSALKPEDTTVLCGDLSWGMNFAEALEDFLFVEQLPGKKIILKGNHDYWWETAAKMNAFFQEQGIASIEILNNNCFPYGENHAICGTRGWFYEEESGTSHDKKIMNRELMRLEASLKAAGEKQKLVFLHYPPKFGSYECEEILNLLKSYEVSLCCAGHIHGKSLRNAFEGEYRGCLHKLVSADYVNFVPQRILD